MSDLSLSSLLLNGDKLQSNVKDAITSADITMTLDHAPVISLGLHDDRRTLLRSGLLGEKVTAQIDGHAYELAQVGKRGSKLTATLEDLAVASLRRHDKPRKAAAGSTTRSEFARLIVREEPWIKFHTIPSPEKIKAEIARGKAAEKDRAEENEDSWVALGRWADEVGWRRYALRNEVYFLPEVFLFFLPSMYQVKENTGPVGEIEFDYDIGKPIASLSFTVEASRWSVLPGTCVDILDQGPASGKWLVTGFDRSLFRSTAKVKCSQPRPVLPEPKETVQEVTRVDLGSLSTTVDEGAYDDTSGPTTTIIDTGSVSQKGYKWPLRGSLVSRFGPRNGRAHEGVDIAVQVGTTVGAAREGTVIFVGEQRGYGNTVMVRHDSETISLYAHLSKFSVRSGVAVAAGQELGRSGGKQGAPGAGNSEGPHLHFEIQIHGHARDPLGFLPGVIAERRG